MSSLEEEDFLLGTQVSLNVGGSVFYTTLGTLTTVEPESMLGRMFSGDNELKKDYAATEIFFDRSPENFSYILDWLRDGELPALDDRTYKNLLREAKYYCLEGLQKAIEGAIVDTDLSRKEIMLVNNISKKIAQQATKVQGANLQGANLQDVNLGNLDLKSFNFTKSVLKGVSFAGAELEGSSFRSSHAIEVDFTDANLMRCDFSSASLVDSDFTGANLRMATFVDAQCERCSFEGAQIFGTDFRNAKGISALPHLGRGARLSI